MSNALIESFKVASTLSSQRIVGPITGTAFGVQYPVTTTSHKIGVTVDDVLDTTNSIPVQLNGIARVYFNDTVTSGQLVTSDTSGRAVPFSLALTSTAISNAAGYLGLLVGASVAQTATIAEVLIQPGYDRATA